MQPLPHARRLCCYRTDDDPAGEAMGLQDSYATGAPRSRRGGAAAYANDGGSCGDRLVCVDWADLVLDDRPELAWLLITPIGNELPEPAEAPERGWLVRWLSDGHVSIIAGPVLGTDHHEEGDEESGSFSCVFDPRPEVFDRLEWELHQCSRGETYFAIEFEAMVGDE